MSDIDLGKRLILSGSLDRPTRWLLAIMLIPAIGIIVAIAFGLPHAAAQARAPAAFAAAVVPLVVLLAVGMIIRSLKRAGVSVEQGTLVINTGMGSKRIALSALRKHGVSVANLNERTELKPWLRLWGTGLPGFAGGWFRLRNGEKAVCLILDRERVSYLRSDADNISVLLSLEQPDALRAMLERI